MEFVPVSFGMGKDSKNKTARSIFKEASQLTKMKK